MWFLRILKQETRLQWRTLRFRFGVLLSLCPAIALPLIYLWLIRPNSSYFLGASSYFTLMHQGLQFGGVLLAMVVAGNRADLAGGRQMWSVLAGASVGNGGYLWRRTLAQVLIVVAITGIPLLTTTALLPMAGVDLSDPWLPLGIWLVLVAPTAAIFVVLWGSMVRITGTELGCMVLLVFGDGMLKLFLEKIVEPLLSVRLLLHGDWTGYRAFLNLRYRLLALREGWESARFLGASDAPFSFTEAWQAWAPQAALTAGLTCIAFAVSLYFARRTARDLAPLVISKNHPLRNFARHFHALRVRYAGEGGFYLGRLGLIAGVVGCAVGVIWIERRQNDFKHLAERRYAAETATEDLAVISATTGFESLSLRGEINEDSLRVEAVGRLEHRGEEPVATLPFELDPFVGVDIHVPGRDVRRQRRWDRLLVTLDPPLAPGEALEWRAVVFGSPADPVFELPQYQSIDSFATRFEILRDGAPIGRGIDLGLSRMGRRLNNRSVVLPASSLTPVLRYGTWKLTPRPVAEDERGWEVPEPSAFPVLDLKVDLQVASRHFLADSCGDSTARVGRLTAGCRTSLSRYQLRGGPQRPAAVSDGLVLAALPGHEDLMAQHLPSLESVVSLSARAWPGLEPIDRLVLLETPPAPSPLNRSFQLRSRGPQSEVFGRLIRLDEGRVVRNTQSGVELWVANLLVQELLNRRAMNAEQTWSLEKIFTAMLLRRMGLRASSGAGVSGRDMGKLFARTPVLKAAAFDEFTFLVKLPALIAYVDSLVGTDNFQRGVEAFLTRKDGPPGTVEELFETLERYGNVSLRHVYEDYFQGTGLPFLSFDELSTRRLSSGRWQVSGLLVNNGTGRVECPILVKAENQEVSTRVAVGGESGVAWEMTLDYEPHTLELDPGLTCYRWITQGRLQVERISLGGGR